MMLEIVCGPRRFYLDKGVYEVHYAVYAGTCVEVRLIPSEKLKPYLKTSDFSLLKSLALLLHLSRPRSSRQRCPSPGNVTLRKHGAVDNLEKQHLASFPVSFMSYNID